MLVSHLKRVLEVTSFFSALGTDETALISILASRSNAQRVEIRKRYKTMFGKDLMNDLKSELSGNLEECLLAIMEPSVLYDAKCLRRAMRVSRNKFDCFEGFT